ncbi:MAG: hypothetical protein SFV51_31615 [Bryobacteraceae bacterium]|nr:hypothetical protein [Bryobacteraceae bacterium]
MKAYLLGDLPADQASALEERYFLDRTFFLEVVKWEDALIADYLAGRMPAADQVKFERRYFQNPTLERRVADARSRLGAHPAAGKRRSWWTASPLVAAATMAIIVVGAVLLLRSSRQPETPTVPVAIYQPPVRLTLTPGMEKGPGAPPADLQLPLPPAGAELVVELPGLVSAARFDATLFRFDSQGGRNAVWSSPAGLSSVAGPEGRQQLTLQPPPGVLAAGDYMIHVDSAAAGITETYLFRVLASQ